MHCSYISKNVMGHPSKQDLLNYQFALIIPVALHPFKY